MKPRQNARGNGLESTTPNKNKTKKLYIHIGIEKNVKEIKTTVKQKNFMKFLQK